MKTNWIAKSVEPVLFYRSHPFLGASPDGEVDKGLVEIKRIFTDGLSLRAAMCKRVICRHHSGVGDKQES